MCCKCYSPILTLKGNICLLEMTIGRLMIALLPVHLCSAMVPRAQGERVHEAQTSDHLTLCPTGIGVAGVDVVLMSIGELLISELTERRWLRAAVLMISQIASFFLIARALRAASTGAVSVGLVYHTLKNYKLSLRYLNGQIAGQLITK